MYDYNLAQGLHFMRSYNFFSIDVSIQEVLGSNPGTHGTGSSRKALNFNSSAKNTVIPRLFINIRYLVLYRWRLSSSS